MTTETWNYIFIAVILFLVIVDSFLIVVITKQNNTIKWASKKIHKFITGDNVEMSIETLSLYYKISEERIDQLLTMEKEYVDDGN